MIIKLGWRLQLHANKDWTARRLVCYVPHPKASHYYPAPVNRGFPDIEFVINEMLNMRAVFFTHFVIICLGTVSEAAQFSGCIAQLVASSAG
jgi:hypothetical protein